MIVKYVLSGITVYTMADVISIRRIQREHGERPELREETLEVTRAGGAIHLLPAARLVGIEEGAGDREERISHEMAAAEFMRTMDHAHRFFTGAELESWTKTLAEFMAKSQPAKADPAPAAT